MEALEVSAKTVEEAIDLALSQLGLSRSEVEVEILQEGKRGILGWGGEEARVKVTPITSVSGRERMEVENSDKSEPSSQPEETGLIAKEIAERLLSLMNVSAAVEMREPEDSESPVTLNIECDDPGTLIGRRGQTLSAFQFVVNFIANRKHKSATRVIIDVAGYRHRRQEELKNMALRIADLVKTNRRSITLEPMLAWERRAVHLTLRDDSDITTGSVGYGDRRKVVISPKRRG